MARLLLTYATPLITGLFMVSLISGVAIFFHLGDSIFKLMHEWLSMVLIVPFVLHLWKNWRPLVGYFSRAPMKLALGAPLVAALAFAIPSALLSPAGGPPQIAFARAILGNPPETVAPLLGMTAAQLVAQLKAKGFDNAAAGITLRDIASGAGQSEGRLMAALLPATP